MYLKNFILFFTAGFFTLQPVAAATVFSDNFESADVDVTDNTADGDGVSGVDGWDRSLSSGSSTFTATNDGTLGNAGLLDNKGNQTFGFVGAQFATQTLVNEGDSLTLTFDFRFSTLTSPDNGANFRFGLWNATSGIDTSGGPNYWGRLATNGTGSLAIFEDSDSFPGSQFGTLGTGDTFSITNTNEYSALFSVTKTAAGVDIEYGFFNAGGTSLASLTVSDNASPHTTFNALGLRTNLANNMVFDNVEVDFSAIPEPSTLTLIGLAGVAVAYGLRRRR